jgi:biopolymer transport protein ExbD
MPRFEDVDEHPRNGVASMVDVAFLMLVFFLVATTIVPTERDLMMKAPTNRGDVEAPTLPIHLEIEDDGSIWWGEESGRLPVASDDRRLPELLALLEPAVEAVRAGGEEPPVVLKVADGAKQQDFINVMDALASVEMTRIWLTDFE